MLTCLLLIFFLCFPFIPLLSFSLSLFLSFYSSTLLLFYSSTLLLFYSSLFSPKKKKKVCTPSTSSPTFFFPQGRPIPSFDTCSVLGMHVSAQDYSSGKLTLRNVHPSSFGGRHSNAFGSADARRTKYQLGLHSAIKNEKLIALTSVVRGHDLRQFCLRHDRSSVSSRYRVTQSGAPPTVLDLFALEHMILKNQSVGDSILLFPFQEEENDGESCDSSFGGVPIIIIIYFSLHVTSSLSILGTFFFSREIHHMCLVFFSSSSSSSSTKQGLMLLIFMEDMFLLLQMVEVVVVVVMLPRPLLALPIRYILGYRVPLRFLDKERN